MPELTGLILSGGKSLRMGADKGLLCYHGKTPQLDWCFELLTQFCNDVYISARQGQYQKSKAPIIIDPFAKGPLGGILSAFLQLGAKPLFVLACDLPFLTAKALQKITQAHTDDKIATFYLSAYEFQPEPLCAIWGGESFPLIEKAWQKDERCPRSFLRNLPLHLVQRVIIDDYQILSNCNTKNDLIEAAKEINFYVPDFHSDDVIAAPD